MNGLVGYESSDEDEEVQSPRPAKIPKLAAQDPALTTAFIDVPPVHLSQDAGNAATEPQPTAKTEAPISTQPIGPSRGPPAATQDEQPASGAKIPDPEPSDPDAYERQRIRELTMPTVPNFDIPDSPPPPSQNSEEAATLAASTKKFERFLELKKQGVHFNERLQNSASLRNPALLAKLMDFVGMSQEDSYGSSLPEEVAVRTQWPEECYVEGLLRQNERREKKRLAERDRLDFVPASKTSDASVGSASKSRSDKK